MNQTPFLNGGECGNTGHKCYGNQGPEHCRDSKEEQKTGQSVCCCMREAEAFEDSQCRNLIDDLDVDNYPCPNPKPYRNLHDGYQPYCATGDKADIRQTVQHGTGLTFGVQFPRKVPIYHIADAAYAIDYPESRTFRITEQQTDGPKI